MNFCIRVAITRGPDMAPPADPTDTLSHFLRELDAQGSLQRYVALFASVGNTSIYLQPVVCLAAGRWRYNLASLVSALSTDQLPPTSVLGRGNAVLGL